MAKKKEKKEEDFGAQFDTLEAAGIFEDSTESQATDFTAEDSPESQPILSQQPTAVEQGVGMIEGGLNRAGSAFSQATEAGVAAGRGVLGAREQTGLNIPNIAEEFGRGAPVVAGTAGGTAIGSLTGQPILGGMAGAGLAKSAQNLAQQTVNAFGGDVPEVSPIQAIIDPPMAALFQGAFAKGSEQMAKALPGIKDGLARMIRGSAGVREGTAKQVLKDPTVFQRTISSKESGKQMGALVEEEGFKTGVAGFKEATGKRFPSQEQVKALADEALDEIESTGTLSMQRAISTRQLMRDELFRPKFENTGPGALKSGDKIVYQDSIKVMDNIIEKTIPGWKKAIRKVAESKSVEEFASLFPANKNMSPNQLRFALNLLNVGSGAGASVATGSPLPAAMALVIAGMQSPFMLSLPIRAAGRMATATQGLPAGVGTALGQMGTAGASGNASQSAEQAGEDFLSRNSSEVRGEVGGEEIKRMAMEFMARRKKGQAPGPQLGGR